MVQLHRVSVKILEPPSKAQPFVATVDRCPRKGYFNTKPRTVGTSLACRIISVTARINPSIPLLLLRHQISRSTRRTHRKVAKFDDEKNADTVEAMKRCERKGLLKALPQPSIHRQRPRSKKTKYSGRSNSRRYLGARRRMSNKINVTFAGKWENKLNVHDVVLEEERGQGIPRKELDRGAKKREQAGWTGGKKVNPEKWNHNYENSAPRLN